MGKRIITQRRGRGGLTYRAPSHRYKGKIKLRSYDKDERVKVTEGVVKDLINCRGHSAPLAVVRYETKEEVLVSAPLGVKVNDKVQTGMGAELKVGNVLPLKDIPEGTLINNVEITPGDGGKLVRTSGSFARVVGKVGDKIIIKLPSRKQKKMHLKCRAMIGVTAGGGRTEKPFTKAGNKMKAMRAKNKLYPIVSGVAMNAVDHPFGSGRGRHCGKPKTAPRFAPAGRNVGLIKARRTGKKK
jgi:large subunit ribosomal protein L2